MFSRSNGVAAPPARRVSTPGDPLADLYEADPKVPPPAGKAVAPIEPVVPAVPAGTVTLSKPYEAFGEPVSSLKFREPKAKDIAAAGKLPFKFDVRVLDVDHVVVDEVHTDWDTLMKYIHLLAEPALTPATVEKFNLEDLDACAQALIPFFMTPVAIRIRLTPLTGSPGSIT
jgi:hypothetical protein